MTSRSTLGLVTVVALASPACGSGTADAESAPESESGGESGGFPDAVPDDCIVDVSAGDHVFACDGLTYDVSVPAACLDGPCGLVLDVHGFSMDGRMEDNNTQMRSLGDEFGFIVVQPNAIPDPPLSSWNPGPDDDKVFDFLTRTMAAWHVDEKRVHMTGFSQGGFMSWRFVCQHADVLASAAPAAGCPAPDGCTFTGDQVPAAQLDILYMHGTDDALVDFSCAEPGRDAIVDAWALGTEQIVSEDPQHRWTRHANADGTVLEFIRHDYVAESSIIVGHCFPGSTDPGGRPGQAIPFGCLGDSAFVWGEVAMQFFVDHPRD